MENFRIWISGSFDISKKNLGAFRSFKLKCHIYTCIYVNEERSIKTMAVWIVPREYPRFDKVNPRRSRVPSSAYKSSLERVHRHKLRTWRMAVTVAGPEWTTGGGPSLPGQPPRGPVHVTRQKNSRHPETKSTPGAMTSGGAGLPLVVPAPPGRPARAYITARSQ